ncbi:MAG TPA: EF-P lysine aminoacylase EpmA [Pirellulaceae bacterium]|nr:EF-P lysine aminoacylase EpmA [Pirellulaceae bacterium]
MNPDFLPTASLETLKVRATLLARIREFFDERGFFEVETPILSHDVVVDRHLDPLSVTLFDDPRQPEVGQKLWLQTSPEFGMKRLIAAGMQAIYQITRAFRGGEIGDLHNPEFTMVEWYRVGDDYEAGMGLLAELATVILGRGTPVRLTYREAFLRYANIDPFDSPHERLAEEVGVVTAQEPDYDAPRDALLDVLLVKRVEPQLGAIEPVILYDYPASQSALARVRPGDSPVAERFELYVDGIELANGYHELLDADVLRLRSQLNNKWREAAGKPTLAEESRLLSAMENGLPPCSGTALGFDRLVMVATGARSLREVMAFPIDRA